MSLETVGVADRFFAAIERDDIAAVRDLYADDLMVWHSYDGAFQTKAENLVMLAGIGRLGTPEYRLIERLCLGDRVVQRHELIIRAHDGSRRYRLHAAIFLTIRHGKIVALEEFLDSRDVAEVVAAIGRAASSRAPSLGLRG